MSSFGTDAKDIAERFWRGEINHQEAPLFQTTHCSLTEVVPSRVYFLMTFCNVIVVRLPSIEGAKAPRSNLVLIDVGSASAAEHVSDTLKQHFFDKGDYVRKVIYTHGHLDHVGAMRAVEDLQRQHLEDRDAAATNSTNKDSSVVDNKDFNISVWGHENVNKRFERYSLTAGYNSKINSRQFGVPAQHIEPLFQSNRRVDREYSQMPGFHHDSNTFPLQYEGLKVELIHCRGETDDGTVVWIPRQEHCPQSVLVPGDLFINCVPNCGNPQKAQRYPLEWVANLRRLEQLKADIMLPGHGPMIIGAERVAQALSETREFLDDIVQQTLTLLNDNASLNEIVSQVRPKMSLVERRPYLKAYYDDPSFIVRGVYRQFGGWYSGFLPDLQPASNVLVGKDLVKLVVGVPDSQSPHANLLEPFLRNFESVFRSRLSKAATREERNEAARSALHFIELVWLSVMEKRENESKEESSRISRELPGAKKLRALRQEVLEILAESQSSLMGRRIYQRAIEDMPSHL